ncbi:MAG TPA: pyridoxamine 5'-phosphate oxidase family protein [Euzebyales bacterium]|nr:pyridoxamine 5'-phosphate oxidase family protein [Euzebyales bacterium]
MTRQMHRIAELDESECRRLLAANPTRLGRVAFVEDGDPNWPTVLPVNYAVIDDAVYFRTFEGSKLYAALRHQRVAFEVDAVDQEWNDGWSVLAVGSLDIVRDPEVAAAADEDLASWAAGADEQLVRLDIDRITGRRVIGPRASA